MQITWLGHGTFQFQWGSGKTLIADPWTEGNPRYPTHHEFRSIDLMIVSHGHFDHIHDAVPLATRFKPAVVGIYELCHWLESKGVENTKPMNKGGTQVFFEGEDEIRVTMTQAVHSCGIVDEGKMIYGGEAAGFVLRFADNRSIYFAGDTAVFSDMQLIAELYHPDLVFLPSGDLYTMGPEQVSKACSLLAAKKLIPMHFGTFPALTGDPSKIECAGTEVWNLEPGEPVEW